jgi:hypothetical protein
MALPGCELLDIKQVRMASHVPCMASPMPSPAARASLTTDVPTFAATAGGHTPRYIALIKWKPCRNQRCRMKACLQFGIGERGPLDKWGDASCRWCRDPEAHSVRLHEDVLDSELLVAAGSGHMVHDAASEAIVAALTDRVVNHSGIASEVAPLAVLG